MKKLYGILTFSMFSMLGLLLTSCGKGNDDWRRLDTYDKVMSICFVLLVALVIGVIIYFIVKHFKQ